MSDPLTALMHAVQVMSLLKTLILKTLSEREEATTAGYSSMSSHSSDRQSEDEYDSQLEMDTSAELRGSQSDCDDHVNNNSLNSEEEVDSASVSEIEECFLKQLNENKQGGFPEEPARSTCSGYNLESAVSFTDTKPDNSCSSSYEDDSGATLSAEGSSAESSSPSIGSTYCTNDVEMMDKFADCVSLVPLFASS